VVAAGGQRRPPGAPQRAAWETLAASLRGELPPVVGVCPACGQPMVGEGPRGSYTIPVEGGAVELRADGTVHGPGGPVEPEAAGELVRRSWPDPRPPLAERAFGALVLALMLIPALIAAWMMWFVFFYLSHLGDP
jgi:hypothetical protein